MIADRRDFRLAKSVRPRRYALRFDLDLDEWRSTGTGTIDLHLDEPAREISLHAVELDIKTARFVDGPQMESASYDDEAQTARLRFSGDIPGGDHTLELEWTGPIRDALRGLYRSTHGGAKYAATQFEATDARRAFPCFDEPEFKARFSLELVHDSGLVAIANGPIERTETMPGGRTLTRFGETPPISTYLVAFTVGPYESTQPVTSRTGVPVQVWLPPGLADKGDYARDVHASSVAWLEDYTAIPYPYGKLDAIGLPDFEAGAMENPGAITYRTTLLAADERTATTAAFKRIFSVVSHELTHMWWGDLVTMAWWNDLWLNESFASFVGEKATADQNPEWGYLRDVVAQATPAFNLDQLASTHPISMEVRNADQASERFDAITYLKGMSVLRMIESFVGEEAFRNGVRIYLDRHAESNATADDFWRALDEASGQNVTAIANNWIFEPGHPLVAATAQRSDGGLHVELRQRRFFADPAATPTDQRWLVPVVIKYGTADGIREERLLMDGESATTMLAGARWYYPNAGGRGFYRYSLDDASIRMLAQSGLGQLAPEERLMLVDNYWALVHAGRAGLRQLLELLAGLRGEQDRAVLDAIADTLAWLSTHAVDDAHRPAFESFVASFFMPVLVSLGWDVRPGESTEDREKRARALSILGRTARVSEVVQGASERIEAYLDGQTQLDPDIASALAGVAAAAGDVALYERYLVRMRESEATDAQEEARFRNALPAFEDPGLVDRTANACFDGTFRLQDRGLMLSSLMGSRHARATAWPILRDHWDADVAPLDPGLKHRIIGCLGQLTPRELERQAAALLDEKHSPDSAEITAQTLERLRLNAAAAARLTGELDEALATVGG
jgi:puromycin-sensitive aminopeptidase